MRVLLRSWLLAVVVLGLVGCSSTKSTSEEATVPDVFRVKLDTSEGDIVIEVHKAWAPLGAARFHELVRSGFYDEARFFRVVPGFVVQFGMPADPALNQKWAENSIPDDPPAGQSNVPGTVTFATRGPNSRTTQLFINLGDNSRLDSQGFTPFGRVVEGMNAVTEINSGYGEQPQQPMIRGQGNAYLKREFPELDYIKTATIAN
jgi:cyclophilin family peptidyl-prolyl cis-trans isomerase